LPVRSIVQKSHPSSGSKVKGRGHQGRHKERQGAAFFSEVVLAGAILWGLACGVCLSNIFSIAGVLGVARLRATQLHPSVNK